MSSSELDLVAARLLETEARVLRARAAMRLNRAYDARAHSLESALETGSVSLVQQQYGAEVDINTIVRRFALTQAGVPVVSPGIYGDFTGVVDYESAVQVVERAQGAFMQLPPEVRERFDNSTAKFLDFAQSVPEEMLYAELGLKPPAVPVPAGAFELAEPAVAPGAPAAPVAPVVV